jgi:hypothetical protein
VKVTRIELKDVRAFPGPETYSFNLAGGKNLLLYGENGSGKSSFYRALVEFFNLNVNARPFEYFQNVFSANPPATDGHVTLEMSDGSRCEWKYGGRRPHRDVAVAQPTREMLIDAARRAALLEYRSLFRATFGVDDVRQRLFELAVSTVLANAPVAVAGGMQRTVSQLWKELAQSIPARHSPPQMLRIGQATQVFNDGLRGILPDVRAKAADFLAFFVGSGLEIELSLPGVRYNHAPRRVDRRIIDCFLDVEVKLRGTALPEWSSFLNEARLSALALSLYLAGAVLSNPVPPSGVLAPLKLLALDDVLIGLDLSNRFPVLRILEDRFADYQVFVLTFDRVWFEFARLALKQSEQWVACELHSRPHEHNGVIFDKPTLKTDQTDLAKHHLDLAERFLTVEHDPRTAAFHARVAFEVKLQSQCKKRQIPVPYVPEGSHLNTDDFLDAIERFLYSRGTIPLAIWGIQRVKLFRKGVLNPLAHAQPVTLAAPEVQEAINSVKALAFRDDKNTQHVVETNTLLSRAVLNDAERIQAACWLRTTFEVDVRELLTRHSGKVIYHKDWTTLCLAELWQAAKDAMSHVNAGLAAPLIAAIEIHRQLFLEEWLYTTVNAFSLAALTSA